MEGFLEEEETHSERPTRTNAGTGVRRLEPNLSGQYHESVKKKAQFLMKKQRDTNNLFDVENGMRRATQVLFTQMSAMKGIKLFGERAIAAIVKELKNWNMDRCQERR